MNIHVETCPTGYLAYDLDRVDDALDGDHTMGYGDTPEAAEQNLMEMYDDA